MKKTIMLLITIFCAMQLSAMYKQNKNNKQEAEEVSIIAIEPVFGNTSLVRYSNNTCSLLHVDLSHPLVVAYHNKLNEKNKKKDYIKQD